MAMTNGTNGKAKVNVKFSGRKAIDLVVTSHWTVVTAGLLGTAFLYYVLPWIFRGIEDARGTLFVTGLIIALVSGASSHLQRRFGRSTHEHMRKHEFQANHDTLTGLPNRVGLIRHLETEVHKARQDKTTLGVLFLDLDRFKVINDTMGHDTGDQLLRAVGERIVSAVRSTDLVARFGGDEFVVVCPGLVNTHSVVQIAAQILASFERPVPLGKGEMNVVPSIGIATSNSEQPRTSEELVRDADAAMYRAKRGRTGYAVFDEQQRQVAMSRLDTERALRIAVAARELDVHYQPIIDGKTRQLTSFEALVRWNRLDVGWVGPGDFLPVAEEAGLMANIGELVLREACAQASVWARTFWKDSPVTMGVNVAERQLVDPNFARTVAEILEWSGLEPWRLTLEITEDLVIDHLDSALSVLRDLKALGVSLAIDDFGTGRSSLSYVKRLDMVDYLKIDKSFVDGLEQPGVDQAIIEAITSLAKALDLVMVAEGVETVGQLDRLVNLGVERIQGYLIEKPLSATDIESRMVSRAADAAAAQAVVQAHPVAPIATPAPATPQPNTLQQIAQRLPQQQAHPLPTPAVAQAHPLPTPAAAAAPAAPHSPAPSTFPQGSGTGLPRPAQTAAVPATPAPPAAATSPPAA